MDTTDTHELTITEVDDSGLLRNVCTCGDTVTGPWLMTAAWADLHLGLVDIDALAALATP